MDRVTDVNGGVDEPGWDVDPDDEIAPVVEMAGGQLRLWREGAGLRVAEFGQRIGYSEDLIRKVERGARIPRPEYLDKVDQVLEAGGKVAAMKKMLAEARYPKKVRELAKLEAQAVEVAIYSNHNIHGLLQTEEYARALFGMRRPAYSPDEVERGVAARVARHSIFDRSPAPDLSFVQEEVTLRRPIGGRMVLRRQLERLLQIGRLRSVAIQVMPTDCEDHAGIDGGIEMLKFRDGTAVGRSEGVLVGRPVSDPKQLRILELRYGMIRAQALTPRESLGFIEQLLGEI
ncbi:MULTISPECIES: helix-turn-helix domain-containing protein [unclassified Streptomyces]|uniref:helix-turn-helix domain-containing protein n=1 Tax=Streptomyces sp. NPDC006678 TaxID=3157185 RepID=UPI00340B6C71